MQQLWQGPDINIEMPPQGMRLPGERALSHRGFAGFVLHFQMENKKKE